MQMKDTRLDAIINYFDYFNLLDIDSLLRKIFNKKLKKPFYLGH